MVGGSDDVVDGTTSSAAWRGVVIRPWVVVDVVGRVCVAVLVDGDLVCVAVLVDGDLRV